MVALIAGAWAGIQEVPIGGGRTALLWEDHAVPVLSVSLTFPDGPARAGWPELGGSYWISLSNCVEGAGGDLGLSATGALVGMEVVTHREDLDHVVAGIAGALRGAWRCGAQDQTDVLDRLREARFASPLARLYALVIDRLHPPGDPRRGYFENDLSTWSDAQEAESLRDRIVGLSGTVLAVAGDCDAACATELARALFPDPAWGTPAAVAPAPAVETPRGEELAETVAGLFHHQLALAWTAPGASDPAWPAFLVVEAAAQQRLVTRLREEQGLLYSVGSTWQATPWPGPWVLQTVVPEGSVPAVRDGLRSVLAALAKEGPTPAELEAVRAQLRARRTPADPRERLRREAERRLAGKAWTPMTDALERAVALSPEDIRRAAGDLLGEGPVLSIHLEPRGD